MRIIEVDKPLLKSLLVLASVIEARDPFTAGHIWRTSRYAKLLAEKIGFTRGDVFLAQLGGLVHDLGKIGIPDALLNKRGRLTSEEYELIKMHPEIGHSIVSNHPLAPLVEEAIAQHHIRFDGKGYPAIYSERERALVPQVISIADAYDAITSGRPYRGTENSDRTIAILESEKGKQFHPQFTDAFLALVREGALEHIIGHSYENRLMLECPECGPIIACHANPKDGDLLDCASCRGELRIHVRRDTFDLEWTGVRLGTYIPRADLDAVEEVLRAAPSKLDLDR